MLRREVVVLGLIFYILVVQFTVARLHIDDEDDNYDDDEIYRLIKRIFSQKSKPASTKRPPSTIDNLIGPASAHPPIRQSSSWTQKTTHSPIYLSSNPCNSNPCNHGGICTPKGQMTYECKCVGPWRGISCSVADTCKNAPCQNGGTCLNVGDDYWCKCSSDYDGTNCQQKVSTLDYSKRGDSAIQSYYNLLHQLKRGMNKQDIQKSPKKPDVAYYDVKNGIYFKRK